MVGLAASPCLAAVPDGFTDELIVSGLEQPVGIAFIPDGRLLVTEQLTGHVRLVVQGQLSATNPIGTVPDVHIGFSNERGLLGVAVDPAWPGKPYVYFLYSSTGSPQHMRLIRVTMTGDLSFTGNGDLQFDIASRHDVLRDMPNINRNHNGGTIRFGPDHMLYASLGDDFSRCEAQDSTSLQGVILRLDVSPLPAGAGGPPDKALITPADNPFAASPDTNARLVFATGLRNPFRFHIDAQNGEVFVGDVGENRWEEINRATPGGRNFGWPLFEGPDPFSNPGPCSLSSVATAPLTSVLRGSKSNASIVTAGFARSPAGATYRFPPEYDGSFFFADYFDGNLRRLTGSGDVWSLASPVPGQPGSSTWATGLENVSDYAFGPDGSLWYCKQFIAFGTPTGQIRRIRPSQGDTTHVGPMLARPYPSPATGIVHLDFSLARTSRVELTLLDVRGRLVRVLEPARTLSAGQYSRVWDGLDGDGRSVPPGLYFARLRVGERNFEQRVPLIR